MHVGNTSFTVKWEGNGVFEVYGDVTFHKTITCLFLHIDKGNAPFISLEIHSVNIP